MPKKKNYTGQIIGQFKVIKDLGNKYPTSSSPDKRSYCIAECLHCGKYYENRPDSFKRGTKKCDCQKSYLVTKEWRRIYKIHFGMISRCYDSTKKDYKKYGAKGIKICDEWRNSCQSFYEWSLKNGYASTLSIDRIDNDKGYFPENCRWATRSQQQQNKKVSLSLEFVKKVKRLLKEGRTRVEISKMMNINYDQVKYIDRRNHWENIN